MITAVRVEPIRYYYGGEILNTIGILDLPVVDAENNVFQILELDGLGPVKADLTFVATNTNVGENLTQKSIGKRNITMTIRLNPNWATQSFADLRAELYQYFAPGQDVNLIFTSDELPKVSIKGIVENTEPDFSDPNSKIQISVLCYNPYFVSEVAGSYLDGALSDDVVTIPVPIVNEGSDAIGFNLKIKSSAARPSYTGDIWIETNYLEGAGGGPIINDVTINSTYSILLSSVDGGRYLRRLNESSGAETSILYAMSSGFGWPVLQPGTNQFAVYAQSAGSGLGFDLTYQNLYRGL